MNTAKRLDESIKRTIPNYPNLMVVFPAKGFDGQHIMRKATYDQVIDRLEEHGAERPDRQFNQQSWNGKLVARGTDEDGCTFWVSIERPTDNMQNAW